MVTRRRFLQGAAACAAAAVVLPAIPATKPRPNVGDVWYDPYRETISTWTGEGWFCMTTMRMAESSVDLVPLRA